MPSELPRFDYSNVSNRPSGWFVRVASKLLRGVRQVQDEVLPFAQAWHAQNLQALAGDPGRPLWIALGDSLTQGIGARSIDGGWVGQTARSLAADGHPYRVLNLAVSGARIRDVIDHQLPALRDLQAQGVAVGLVTVLIGSNDLVLRKHRDALPGAFDELVGLLPQGAVVANLPNPRAAADGADRVLRAADAAGRIVLADMRQSATMNWRGKLAADHFHPNELGYAGIARTFHESIRNAQGP